MREKQAKVGRLRDDSAFILWPTTPPHSLPSSIYAPYIDITGLFPLIIALI